MFVLLRAVGAVAERPQAQTGVVPAIGAEDVLLVHEDRHVGRLVQLHKLERPSPLEDERLHGCLVSIRNHASGFGDSMGTTRGSAVPT